MTDRTYKPGDRVMTNDMVYGTIGEETQIEADGVVWYEVRLDSGRRTFADSWRLMPEADALVKWGRR